MAELKTVDREFTWTNNHMYIRIDRALGNSELMQQWHHLEAILLDPSFSDHALICVNFAGRQT